MTDELERLILLLNLRRYADGEAYAREVIGRNPEWGTPYSYLAQFLMNRGRRADAVAAARNGVAHAPHDAWAHAVLAVALSADQKYRRALASATEAIRLDPTFAFGYAVAAEVQCGRGEFQQALAAARAGQRHAPADELLLSWEGWAGYKRRAYAEAEAAADRGLAAHPNSTRLHNLKGCCLMGRADSTVSPVRKVRLYRAAEAAFLETLRRDPADHTAQYNRVLNAVLFRNFFIRGGLFGLLVIAITVASLAGQKTSAGAVATGAAGFLSVAVLALPYLLSNSRRLTLALPLSWASVPRPPITVEQRAEDRKFWLSAAAVVAAVVGLVTVLVFFSPQGKSTPSGNAKPAQRR